METIRLIVRNLVFLVLLAAFLEMLLPLRETRRFVRAILGLFILVTVLNPVVALFRQAPILNFETPGVVQSSRRELDAIFDRGKTLQQANTEQAQAAYVKRLEEQVAVMARLVPGVGSVQTRVVLDTAPSRQSLGAISKVYVTVAAGDKETETVVAPVEKVHIGEAAEQGQDPQEQPQKSPPVSEQEVLDRVQETVVSLFGLRPEQVSVNLEADAHAAKKNRP